MSGDMETEWTGLGCLGDVRGKQLTGSPAQEGKNSVVGGVWRGHGEGLLAGLKKVLANRQMAL